MTVKIFREKVRTETDKRIPLGRQDLSVTYQVVLGKKEQEKCDQVVLAPRGHIYF